MKKFIALSCVAGLYLAFAGKKVSAWFGATHEDFASKALDLIEKDGKARPITFFKDYRSIIISGTTEPDHENDVDSGSGLHYYVAATTKGKEVKDTNGYFKNRLGKFSKSARTLFEENYTMAVSYYKSGDIKLAMKYLGRSLHFISDVGCTYHAAGIKSQDKATNPHYAYEKHANTICKQYVPNSYDKRLNKLFDAQDFSNAINRLAKTAAKFGESVTRLDPKAFDIASAGTIPLTQQYCAAVLLKFYEDCNNDNGNFIVNKKAYTFKSERTNGVLTVTKNGLILDNPDKKQEQKLSIIMTEEGSFGIKISDGGYVNESCKAYDYLKIGATPAQFKIAALGKRRFRISNGGSDFNKVLTTTKSGALTISDFEPTDEGAVWILN